MYYSLYRWLFNSYKLSPLSELGIEMQDLGVTEQIKAEIPLGHAGSTYGYHDGYAHADTTTVGSQLR